MAAHHTSQSERSIHEMLRDTPSMNESASAIHSGAHEPVRAKHPSSLPLNNVSAPTTPSTAYASSASALNGSASSSGLSGLGSMSLGGGVGGGSVGSVSDTSAFIRSSATKIDTIRNWSISTYKCTRQLMLEKLGKSTRTVDSELEAQIEQLRDTQRKYLQVLRLTRALHSHFHHVVQTQHCLAEAFSDLAQKSPELQEEFTYNSDAQRSLTKNGELLLAALNFFTASVSTLCNKTIEDTLITVRQYETARIEYDAYRTDLENARPLVGLSGGGGAAVATASATTMSMPGGVGEEAQRSFAKHRDSYEKLRADIAVKMQFLDENRVSVFYNYCITSSYIVWLNPYRSK